MEGQKADIRLEEGKEKKIRISGKEQRKVNYCIRDNTSVSRCHAKISKQGWQYYIEDQNSTNGTYVEGKALHPYQETALSDNVTIRLSDEVFEFHFM